MLDIAFPYHIDHIQVLCLSTTTTCHRARCLPHVTLPRRKSHKTPRDKINSHQRPLRQLFDHNKGIIIFLLCLSRKVIVEMLCNITAPATLELDSGQVQERTLLATAHQRDEHHPIIMFVFTGFLNSPPPPHLPKKCMCCCSIRTRTNGTVHDNQMAHLSPFFTGDKSR